MSIYKPSPSPTEDGLKNWAVAEFWRLSNQLMSTGGGSQGLTGAQGPQGIQGIQGEQGVIGPIGTQGIQGIQGDAGVQGAQGIQGIQGIQGEQGIQGITGAGVQGIQGIQGITGIQGPLGPQGPVAPPAKIAYDSQNTGISAPFGEATSVNSVQLLGVNAASPIAIDFAFGGTSNAHTSRIYTIDIMDVTDPGTPRLVHSERCRSAATGNGHLASGTTAIDTGHGGGDIDYEAWLVNTVGQGGGAVVVSTSSLRAMVMTGGDSDRYGVQFRLEAYGLTGGMDADMVVIGSEAPWMPINIGGVFTPVYVGSTVSGVRYNGPTTNCMLQYNATIIQTVPNPSTWNEYGLQLFIHWNRSPFGGWGPGNRLNLPYGWEFVKKGWFKMQGQSLVQLQDDDVLYTSLQLSGGSVPGTINSLGVIMDCTLTIV